MASVVLLGTGSHLPEHVLTNRDFSMMVETSDDWIVTRTGIRERRICPADLGASDLGLAAAAAACSAAGVEAGSIDVVICATITPDQPFPSTACNLARKLGMGTVPGFDLQAACSGFLYGLELGKALLLTGRYRRALVVAAECMSRYVDYTDRATCVLLGDGAGAAVLERREGDGIGILDCYLMADGRYKDILYAPAPGSRHQSSAETVEKRLQFMKMEGSTLFRIAIETMCEAARELLKRNGLTKDDIALVVPHQANLRIINGVARALGLPPEKMFVNIERYGNMSAACVPIALDEAVRQGKITAGDRVLMIAFGGGLTWGGALVRWGT